MSKILIYQGLKYINYRITIITRKIYICMYITINNYYIGSLPRSLIYIYSFHKKSVIL